MKTRNRHAIVGPEESWRAFNKFRDGIGPAQGSGEEWPFKPTDLSPLFYYHADTGTVGSWTDQSGNGYHLLQATGGLQPSIVTGVYKGHRCYRFDGVDNYMQAAFVLAAQPLEYFLVAKLTTGGGSSTAFVDGLNADSAEFLYDSGGELYLLTSGVLNPHQAPPSAAMHLFDCQFNGASSSLGYDTATPVTGTSPTEDIAGVTLGAKGDGTSPGAMDVCALIGFAAIQTAANRSRLIAWSQREFGTP